MISVNATTVFVAVVCLLMTGWFGFFLCNMLKANKQEEPGEDEPDLTTCIHPACQRRKTKTNWQNERLLKIGYERYIAQCDKEKDMRKDEERESLCNSCTKKYTCGKLNIATEKDAKIIKCNDHYCLGESKDSHFKGWA